jgi:hypothetical protein
MDDDFTEMSVKFWNAFIGSIPEICDCILFGPGIYHSVCDGSKLGHIIMIDENRDTNSTIISFSMDGFENQTAYWKINYDKTPPK